MLVLVNKEVKRGKESDDAWREINDLGGNCHWGIGNWGQTNNSGLLNYPITDDRPFFVR